MVPAASFILMTRLSALQSLSTKRDPICYYWLTFCSSNWMSSLPGGCSLNSKLSSQCFDCRSRVPGTQMFTQKMSRLICWYEHVSCCAKMHNVSSLPSRNMRISYYRPGLMKALLERLLCHAWLQKKHGSGMPAETFANGMAYLASSRVNDMHKRYRSRLIAMLPCRAAGNDLLVIVLQIDQNHLYHLK